MPVNKSHREVFLRMGVGHIREADRFIRRFTEHGSDNDLSDILHHLEEAEAKAQAWAVKQNIVLRQSMPT